MKLYITGRQNSYSGICEYDAEKNEFTVKKGSHIKAGENSNPDLEKIYRLRQQYAPNNIVIKDITFKSASTAASFVIGRSTNGWTRWRDAEKRSLAELFRPEQGK